MKLTKEDRQYLREICHENEAAIEQIERASQKTVYEYQGKRISEKRALEILGRKQLLSALDRSAFHWTACTGGTDEDEWVYLDSSRFFKEGAV